MSKNYFCTSELHQTRGYLSAVAIMLNFIDYLQHRSTLKYICVAKMMINSESTVFSCVNIAYVYKPHPYFATRNSGHFNSKMDFEIFS